jgi:hypothetical protein
MLLLPGFDYDQITMLLQSGKYSEAARMAEPALSEIATAQGMDTPRLILFDLLTVAYACFALDRAREGLSRAARREERWGFEAWRADPGRIVQTGDTFFFETSPDRRVPLDPAALRPIEIGKLAARSLHDEASESLLAAEKDRDLLLSRASLLLYTGVDQDFRAALVLLRRAAVELKSRLAEVFLAVVQSR